MNVLVTGGAGYIGSHTCVELINKGHSVVVIDNFSNSCAESIKRVELITGKEIKLYNADVRDEALLEMVFSQNKIDAVIHFAGLKAVGESCAMPIEYYSNNIGSTLTLVKVMRKYNCKNIVFSSSATVYGEPERLPLTEDCKVGGTTNPYGTSKLFQERILSDLYDSDNSWTVTLLRYFNPIGAHESGLIGEDPNDIPNNLTPYIARVAVGKYPEIGVFGNDYDTIDGTGVRDYIHVVDLACGHVLALEKLTNTGVHIFNLGTGRGYSVLEVIKAFEKACGFSLKYKFLPRRAGDVAISYANPKKANEVLGWHAKFDIDDMCKTLWNWQSNNPDGYNKINSKIEHFIEEN